MYRHISVGIVHWMAYPESRYSEDVALEGIKRLACDSFFTALELCPVGDNIKEEVKRILQAAQLKVNIGGGAPLSWRGLNLASLEEKERQEAADFCKKLVDDAYFFAAQSLMLVPGADPGDAERDKAKEKLITSLDEVCRYAEEKAKSYTLTITFEYFDRDVDKKRVIGPTPEAVELARTLKKRHHNFGLTVDLSHLSQLRETSTYAIQAAGSYIKHAHLANCVLQDPDDPLFGDKHPPFGVPGGENDIPEVAEFLRNLDKVGFFASGDLPIVSCEIRASKDYDVELVIANAKRTIRQAWLLAFP